MNGRLIDHIGDVSSYFTDSLDDATTARFSVRATKGAVGSNLVEVSGHGTPPVSVPRNLRGDVYSATALEIFYDRDIAPSAKFEIYRNGELLLSAHTGTSLFESGLEPETEYIYSVRTVVEGVKSLAATITLKTMESPTW